MPRKRTTNREINRIEHKQARAAERQALEGGHHRAIHGMGWGTRIPQPPLLDEHTVKHPGKRKGCKRNKGGPHDIVHWPMDALYEIFWNEEKQRHDTRPISWARRRYHPPYRCSKCGKGFYRPNKAVRAAISESHPPEHWAVNHIVERLHGGQKACTCKGCNPS